MEKTSICVEFLIKTVVIIMCVSIFKNSIIPKEVATLQFLAGFGGWNYKKSIGKRVAIHFQQLLVLSKPATVVFRNKTCCVPAPHFSTPVFVSATQRKKTTPISLAATEVTSDRSPVGALSWQFRWSLNFGKSQAVVAVVGNRGWMEMLISKHFC